MLVLSRKTGEEIRIGSCVNLTVLAVSRGRVKLGISGPRAIRVARAELSAGASGNDEERQLGGALPLTGGVSASCRGEAGRNDHRTCLP